MKSKFYESLEHSISQSRLSTYKQDDYKKIDVLTKYVINEEIDNTRNFRNRIFQYEPIYHQNNLQDKHTEIFDALGWLNKDMKILNELFDEFKHIETDRKRIFNILENF